MSADARRTARRRRWIVRIAVVAGCAALAVALLFFALRSRSGRRAMLDWAQAAIEESTGLRVTVEDFWPHPPTGEIVFVGIAARAPAEQVRAGADQPLRADRPFLTVAEARASPRWGSLLGGRIVLRSVHIEEPRLDLGVALPKFDATAPEEDAGDGRSLDIESFTVRGGSVISGDLPADLEMWLNGYSAESIGVEGSYRAEELRLEVTGAELVAASARRPPIAATLRAAVARTADGAMSVEALELVGDGLRLEGAGGADAAGEPMQLAVNLHMEPARLFPDLTSGGGLDASGELSLSEGKRLLGSLRLDARELPGELLQPLLASSIDLFDPAGTEIMVDADVDFALDLRSGTAAEESVLRHFGGHAAVDWQRGDEQLVTAGVRSIEDQAGAPVRLAVEAEILPADAGRRQVAARLLAPGWADLADGELEEARLDLEIPDLAAMVERLGYSGAPGGFRPAGELRATAQAEGPLRRPEIESRGTWLLDAEPLLEWTARTLGGVATIGSDEPARVHLQLDAALLPAEAGQRSIAGELLVADVRDLADAWWRDLRLRDLRVDLELPDLAASAEGLRRRWRILFPEGELPASLAADGPAASLWTGEANLAASGGGPVLGPSVELDGGWRPGDGESISLTARGEVASAPTFFSGEALLTIAELDLARFTLSTKDLSTKDLSTEEEEGEGLAGTVDAVLRLGGSLDAPRAELELDGRGLSIGTGPTIEPLHLAARSDGESLEIEALTGALSTGQPFTGEGRFDWRPSERLLPGSGELRLELAEPIETLERVIATVSLETGARLETEVLQAEIEFQPVGAQLRPVAVVRAPLPASWSESDGEPEPGEREAAPGEVLLALSGLQLEPFLPLLALEEDALRPRATFDGTLQVDLADPFAAAGSIEVSGLAFEGPERTLEAAESLRLELADGRLELRPARLLADASGTLMASGSLDLAQSTRADWSPEDGLAALVEDLAFDLSGRFDTSRLEALLEGKASGVAEIELRIRGPLSAPVAEGRLDGTGATLFYASPYATRIEDPVIELSTSRGGTSLDSFRARLNGGTMTGSGSVDREAGLALRASAKDVRYRVDYGLTVRASGELELKRPRGGPSLLTGDLVIERGVLRRDLQIDREMLSVLLAPDLINTEEARFFSAVDLDLTVTTAEGVRVKNNLADLRADWSRLRVRGTLQNPLLEGRIEVDPGGRITGYGQTVRIDEASLAFSGDAAVAPRLVLETTSSLEDPTLRQHRRGLPQNSLGDTGPGAGGFWDNQRSGTDVDVGDELESGLVTHYTNRIAGALTGGLSRTELSLEPLPIFGETDTQARLTATQRLSANADLVYSVNPREAEGQTYILDLHGYAFAPSVRSQLFTNDDNNEGATLVQILELGGGGRGDEGPRLRRVRVEAPAGISRRSLTRAIGLRKGDPLPEGAAFDAEVDALEELRRQGHPEARVAVSVEPAGRKVELRLAVEPGPRVAFEFEGEEPPRRDRQAIAQVYRVTGEAAALEEMRRSAVKALRGAGFLEPRVEVSVTVGEDGSRTVRVLGEGGRRIDPGPPELLGLGPEESAALAAQFESRLARVELAAAAEGADRYLRQLLKALGYPSAEIIGRELDGDGRWLVVDLEPGRRRHVREIEITGLPPDSAARIRARLPIAEGDPARSDLVTRAAHAIEDELRARGHAGAEVHTTLEAAGGEAPGGDLTLRFAVDPGPEHRVSEVRFEGLAATRPSFAKRVAGLATGGVFREQDLSAARARLSRTGQFESIRTTSGGGAPPEAGGGDATVEMPVVFEVSEQPRYQVAYGGRWESGEGVGVVADVIDRNFLGRGTTLGLRAIYSGTDERSLRLYGAAPRVLGTRAGLEVFVEGKNEDFEVQVEGETEHLPTSSVESWAQVTAPLGPRTQHRVYLRYQDIHFLDLRFEEGSSASGIDAEPDAGERVVIPSLGWQLAFDTRGRQRAGASGVPSPDGLFFGLDLLGAHEDLGSDYSVLGVFTQLKLFTTLAELGEGSRTPGTLTWAQSLRLGLQEPFADTDIPIVNRLRAGGEYSVRGYRTDSLGPLDDNGTSLGGEVFFILNEELRFPLWRDLLSGLVFFDAGNVWASRDALDSELFTAAGFGLRADTPAGRLRLDVAVPLDCRPDLDDDVKVYLGFGHVF
ncbi:MAG: BamA/TamA family outer membrane protein [bacterium]|nr:BamA/TamA family outer membrane protein [bacterium]